MAQFPILTWKVPLTGTLDVIATGAAVPTETKSLTHAGLWGFGTDTAGGRAATDTICWWVGAAINSHAEVATSVVQRTYSVSPSTPHPVMSWGWSTATAVTNVTLAPNTLVGTSIGLLSSATSGQPILSTCNAAGWWSPNLAPITRRQDIAHEWYGDESPYADAATFVHLGQRKTHRLVWDVVEEAYVLSVSAQDLGKASRAGRSVADPNNLLQEALYQMLRGNPMRLYTAHNTYIPVRLDLASRPTSVEAVAAVRPDDARLRTVTLLLRETTE